MDEILNLNKYQMQNMHNKKKGESKKLPIRKKAHKSFLEPDDTFNTTKEKTFATIEETFEFHDHKTSTRTTHYTSKRDYLDRMEANKLSPFSSPGHSVSPRPRKCSSPIVVKQKQRKKIKKNLMLQINSKSKKTPVFQQKSVKTPKARQKSSIPKAKAQFQNQFLKRMNKVEEFNNKKITQLSEEQMQASIKKRSKPSSVHLTLELKKANTIKNQKNDVIRKMHTKIKQKYRKNFPKLKFTELRVLSAIVLVQRLWRQRKVKQMIGQYLSSKAFVISQNATFGNPMFFQSLKQNEDSEIQYTMKTEKSLISVSPKCHKKSVSLDNMLEKQKFRQNQQKCEKDNKRSSNQSSLLSLQPSRSSINLKDLQLSDELSSNNSEVRTKQMRQYVDMYREVMLHKRKDKKKSKKNHPNAFNFPESFSQKCLLQKLYKKSFSNLKKQQFNNAKGIQDAFFPHKNLEKSKQFISPNKPDIVQLEQRFYTQAQDEELVSITKIKEEKQAIKPEDQTVGAIGQIAQEIIDFLMGQFSVEYQEFTSKKCLKKKKKLPGIHINQKTILTYLNSFAGYVEENYHQHMKRSMEKITPASFLKVFRICPEQDIFESGSEEEQQDEEDFKIIPKTTYFQYQQIYEDSIFTINEEQKKYSNFVSGLIKIHNKCLSDAFSEILEKQRIDNILLPWDTLKSTAETQRLAAKKFQDIKNKFDETKTRIIKMSNSHLGKLRGRDMEVEEANLLTSLKEDYQREGKDWSCHEDSLEIRLELAQMITEQLYAELLAEISNFRL